MNTRKLELSIDDNRYGKEYNECGCQPMCTLYNYDTEITEIEYDRRKEYESLGIVSPDENGR